MCKELFNLLQPVSFSGERSMPAPVNLVQVFHIIMMYAYVMLTIFCADGAVH